MRSGAATWAVVPDAEAKARVARLRRSATSFQDVYGAFTPWQQLTTGVQEFDAVLGAAGVCGRAAGGAVEDDRYDSDSLSGGGGLYVGGLHELYGPPQSGKSWLLRRIGVAYVRRMTAYRQWYHDERDRDSVSLVEAAVAENEEEEEATGGADGDGLERSVGSPPVRVAAVAAVEEWDLFVCRVHGAGAGSAAHPRSASTAAHSSLSPDERVWLSELLEPFADSLAPISRLADDCPTATARRPVSPEHRGRRRQQCDYVERHVHFAVVHSPNELLEFLESLDETAAASPDDVAQPPSLARAPTSTPASTLSGHKRQRRLCDATASPAVSPSPSPAPRVRLWRLQRHRLLLLDGLDALWLHPSLGTHSATHAGQWFAEELQRQLRPFLAPRSLSPRCDGAAGPLSASESHPQRSLHSTVVLTNGCHGGSYSLSTQQQLEARLAALGRAEVSTAALPRPLGNTAWWQAADTRCLVEPASPGLVSLAASGSAAAPPRRTHARPNAAQQSSGLAPPSESLLSVLKGGSRVAATWVPRYGAVAEYEMWQPAVAPRV
ncbi:hypothetical protein NESM_000633400 [Novymonas esmeraldas]|uniref:Uncharacterized protein n=1 Tax=Novymonas esmeraldas TaxID=1808958 RepID=A0AAW0ET68_9TRYP